MSEPGKLKQLLSPSNWLVSALLAIGGTLGTGLVAVLAGWWEVLSKAILPQTTAQQLLNTTGILVLIVLGLSFFLIQSARLTRRLKEPKRTVSVPQRLHELQEQLLVIAANTPISNRTLHEDAPGVHLEESKYHYDVLFSKKLIAYYSSYSMALSQAGREYLLRHGLMPPPPPAKTIQRSFPKPRTGPS